MQKTDLKSSAADRGKRLKSLRTLAGLSRKALEQKYEISASTIQSWEDGKAGGLTEKGAWRVVSALRKEHVQSSVEWLLYGAGIGPKLVTGETGIINEATPDYQSTMPKGVSADDNAIMQELLAFRKYNAAAVDMIIIDDAMAPIYQAGDYVGGKKRMKESINALIGLDCIIETAQGEILLRRLKNGTKSEHYTLANINPDSVLPQPMLYDVKIISAAPVIWHRRKDQQF